MEQVDDAEVDDLYKMGQLVIESRLWRNLCIRRFPEIEMFEYVVVGGPSAQLSMDVVGKPLSPQQLLIEHHAYSTLCKQLSKEPWERSCISKSISASSTDNFPDESIAQTLYPSPTFSEQFPSYWSSKGQKLADVPEYLTYELVTRLCVVHEVRIRPFEAYFQYGNPIYSAKFVRFRMGYSSSWNQKDELSSTSTTTSSDSCDDYIWTYTSQEFPMVQADTLQHFKLEPPALCVGGVIQIELLGRCQTQRADQLYYICICHVNVVGTPIPDFDCEVVQGKVVLRHDTEKNTSDSLCQAAEESEILDDEPPAGSSNEHSFAARVRQLDATGLLRQDRLLLNTVMGNAVGENLLLDQDQEASSDDEDEYMVNAL
ncbi:hypothetical protein O6H91_21G014100 [Diphasiastrum complanatum]|uniref:Uncharacterized protein n=1 Tax=Diphasiastrum complanatum TaxID=34168 RepID=A0ACC2AI90_DIPCM|nr:hypothetical protein O6H91_21G014100 [Diphasiastrum complanatum]